MAKQLDMIKSQLREENSSSRSFINPLQKYGRERSYHMSGNMSNLKRGGDMMMCDNYGAVTYLCITYPIQENILYAKSAPYAEEIIGEYHGGFQKGRSTVEQILLSEIYCKNFGNRI
jgi:hypothetical protein